MPSTDIKSCANGCVGTQYMWSVPCASILPPARIFIVIKHVFESYCCCILWPISGSQRLRPPCFQAMAMIKVSCYYNRKPSPSKVHHSRMSL